MGTIIVHDNMAFRWNFDGDTYTLHVKQGDAYCEPPRVWLNDSPFRWDIIGMWRDERPYYVEQYESDDPPTWLRKVILEYFPDASADPYELTVEEMLKLISERAFIVPIWFNDHAQLSLAVSENNPFRGWDCGLCGWYVRFEKSEDAMEIARESVQELEDYMNGVIYCYDLYCESCDGVIDRSFGYIGEDPERNGLIEHVGCGLPESIRDGSVELGSAKRTYSYEFKF